MTFTEIRDAIAGRLNLTSVEALARIGESINEGYKEVTSAIGLITSIRTVVTNNTALANQYLTFVGVTKVLSVFDPTVLPPRVLGEVTFDELRNSPASSNSSPQTYAVANMGSASITVFLDGPAASVFPLAADAYADTSTLSGSMVPAFANNFHNLLIYSGMEIEYEKMEKLQLAERMRLKKEKRLSELRMYIAISAYKDLYQGKALADRFIQ